MAGGEQHAELLAHHGQLEEDAALPCLGSSGEPLLDHQEADERRPGARECRERDRDVDCEGEQHDQRRRGDRARDLSRAELDGSQRGVHPQEADGQRLCHAQCRSETVAAALGDRGHAPEAVEQRRSRAAVVDERRSGR